MREKLVLRVMRVRPLVVVTAMAGVLGIAACGGGEDAGPSAGDGRKEVSLAFVTGIPAGQDSVEMRVGIEAAARDFGPIDFDFNPSPNFDPVAAQRQVADLLSTGPDAMGVSPFAPELWQRTLRNASEQVDTLAFQSKPVETPEQADSTVLETFVGLNDKALGRAAMQATIEASGLSADTTGTALLGQCVPLESGSLFERVVGFRQALAAELPEVKVKVFDSKAEPRENVNAWESALQSTRDAVVAIGACDQDGASIYNIKRRSGSDVVAGALEVPPEVIRGIKDGTVAAAAADNYWLTGYVMTRLLADVARDGAELPVGFIDTGHTVVTKANVDEIELRNSSPEETAKWYAPKVEELFAELDSSAKPLADAWK